MAERGNAQSRTACPCTSVQDRHFHEDVSLRHVYPDVAWFPATIGKCRPRRRKNRVRFCWKTGVLDSGPICGICVICGWPSPRSWFLVLCPSSEPSASICGYVRFGCGLRGRAMYSLGISNWELVIAGRSQGIAACTAGYSSHPGRRARRGFPAGRCVRRGPRRCGQPCGWSPGDGR